MKNRNVFLLFLSIFVCLEVLALGRLAWGAERPLKMSLDEVLSLCGRDNPILMAADAKVRQARGRLIQVQSDQLPQVSASLSYQQLNETPLGPAYTDSTLTVPIGVAQLGFEKTAIAAVNLTQVVFSGGSLAARTESARLLLEAAEAERDRVYQGVENGTRSAYYGLQRALSRYAVAEEAKALSLEHLRQVEAFYRAGVVAQNEVLRVKVAVSSAELNRIRANSAVQVAWKTLERLSGKSLQETYAPPESDARLDDFAVPDDPTARALSMRPELKGLESAQRAAKATLRAVKGQTQPQVALAAQANLTDDHLFPSEIDQWSIAVVAKLRLFDSGKVHGQVVEARSAAEELLNRLEDLKRQVGLEVATARLNLDSAVQRVNVAGDAVSQAEEDYRMALKRYQAQVGTNIDVLDARLAFTDAKNALTDAVAEARTAYSDLLFAMGDLHRLKNKEASQ